MTEDESAAKIQAGFRGMKARKQVKERREQDQAAVKIQAGFKGMKARRQVKVRKEQDQAAAKIQAGFKGMKARKTIAKAKELQRFNNAHAPKGKKSKGRMVKPDTRGNSGIAIKGNSDGKKVGKWKKKDGKMVRDAPAPVTFASFGGGSEYCTNCGRELHDGAKFCSSCGTPSGGKKKKGGGKSSSGGSPRKGLRAGGGGGGGGYGRGMGSRSNSSGMGSFGF